MKLADFRRIRGITGAQAARELGVDAATFSRWERGLQFPRGVWLRRLSSWSLGAVTAEDMLATFNLKELN